MSARAGLLIVALVLALGGALYLILDPGTGQAEASGLEPGLEAETDASSAVAVEGGGPTELDAPEVSLDDTSAERTAVAPAEEPADATELATPDVVDRSAVAVLSGYVRDEQGRPVVGAHVLASRNSIELMVAERFSSPGMSNPDMAERFKEATTDDDGFFEIVGITPGQPGLRIRAAGFVPQNKTDVLIAAREHQALAEPIVLDTSVVLTGVVLDENGAPVAGAKVSATKKQSGMMSMAMSSMAKKGVETADDGSFRLDMLELDVLEVVASHPAYADDTLEVDTRESAEIDGIELQLNRGASIQGRVSGLTPGAVETLHVVALPSDFNFMQGMRVRSCDVAPDGFFELSGMQDASKWNVFGSEGDVEDINIGLIWSDAGRITNQVEATAGDRGLQLEYRPTATVSFQVVDSATGRPITRLQISSMASRPFTDSRVEDYPAGRVRLERQRPTKKTDEIQIDIDAAGYEARVERVDVARGPEIDLGVLELDPAVLAQFRTVDALTLAPVEDVQVTVEGQEPDRDAGDEDGTSAMVLSDYVTRGEARSDADGIARVETELDGTFNVTARADGYGPFRLSDVQLVGSDVTPVSIELSRGATVLVSAKDVFGLDLPARTIEHRAPDAGRSFLWGLDGLGQVTDMTGVATFENLGPGAHRFRIAKLESSTDEPNMMMLMMAMEAGADDDDESWTTVEVRGTDVRELELVEVPTGSLSGRVTEDGKPLRSAQLSLRKVGADEEEDEDVNSAEAMFRKMGREMGGQGAPTAKTDRDGSYALEGVEVGDYVLSIDFRKRAMPAEYPIRIVAGDQVQDFDLEIAILSGKVLDPNGEGVKGALVSVAPYVEPAEADLKEDVARELMGELLGVQGKFRTVKTRRSGSFELRGVTPNTKLVVHVDGSEAGYQNASSQPLEVPPNGSRDDLELVVQQGGTLDVTVLDADGTAADFVLVRLERTDGSMEPLNEVAMGGVKEVTGLTPGTYRVVADDDPDEEAVFGDGDASTIGKVDTTVEIVGGETVTIELRLPE